MDAVRPAKRAAQTKRQSKQTVRASYLVASLGKVQHHHNRCYHNIICEAKRARFADYYLQHFRYAVRHRFLGAQHRMATQLVLQLAALVPIDPAEDFRIVARRTAERDAMRPVFGEAVLPRGGLQAGWAEADTHRDVRLVVLRVVAPQCGQRFLHAAFACLVGVGKKNGTGMKYTLGVVEPICSR